MPSMDGALIIDKPAGMTSHDVVARVRKTIGERRVGHTGTLDPFATGVLVVLVGRATRLAQFLSGAEKEYEALIRFGYATDTGDVTGARIESPSPQAERGLGGEVSAAQPHPQSLPTCGEGRNFKAREIEDALASLRGEIEQVPPMYSAKKVAGRKLYEHARRGEQVERKPVRVLIREFEARRFDDELLPPNVDGSADLRVRVVCSAGTYVRVLAEDLGKQLGVGAHLAELRRTRAGRFTIDQAITLDQLAEYAAANSLTRILMSANDALSNLSSIALDEDEARRTRHGIDLEVEDEQAQSWEHGNSIRMTVDSQLIAVGKFDAQSRTIHPTVVLTDA